MADKKSTDEAKSKGVGEKNKPQAIGRSIAKTPFSRLKPTSLLKGLRFQPVLRPSTTPVPTAPGTNPFKDLPFPSPGDRIKADDFKKLSQSLNIIHDIYSLSSGLFGQDFGEVKLALLSQQYVIEKIMTVFGTEIDDVENESFDNRKVIQVIPVELGERQVAIILTEAVETRRFAPNLLGLTYKEASERLRMVLGDITFPITPYSVSQMVGLSLEEAQQTLSE